MITKETLLAMADKGIEKHHEKRFEVQDRSEIGKWVASFLFQQGEPYSEAVDWDKLVPLLSQALPYLKNTYWFSKVLGRTIRDSQLPTKDTDWQEHWRAGFFYFRRQYNQIPGLVSPSEILDHIQNCKGNLETLLEGHGFFLLNHLLQGGVLIDYQNKKYIYNPVMRENVQLSG